MHHIFDYANIQDMKWMITLRRQYFQLRVSIKAFLKLEKLAYIDKINEELNMSICMTSPREYHAGIKMALIFQNPKKPLLPG